MALLVRRPVVAWHALDLGTGRGRLPLVVPDPVTGRTGVLLFPDERHMPRGLEDRVHMEEQILAFLQKHLG